MVKPIYAASALALGMATAAHAEEHLVVLTGFTYFPAVVYVDPGDTIRFINSSGEDQVVVGKDAGWTIGPLANNEEGTLEVTAETELKFFAAYQGFGGDDGLCNNGNDGSDGNCGSGNDAYGKYEDAAIKAEITFADPPLDG